MLRRGDEAGPWVGQVIEAFEALSVRDDLPTLPSAATGIATLSGGEQRVLRLMTTLGPDGSRRPGVGWTIEDLYGLGDPRGRAIVEDWISIVRTQLV